MVKETKDKEVVQQPKEETKKEVTMTLCWLKSKANYIIEVKEGSQSKFIQPFGKIKVIKEQLSFVNDSDAAQLTFIKA